MCVVGESFARFFVSCDRNDRRISFMNLNLFFYWWKTENYAKLGKKKKKKKIQNYLEILIRYFWDYKSPINAFNLLYPSIFQTQFQMVAVPFFFFFVSFVVSRSQEVDVLSIIVFFCVS